jgi:uncharacterized membrane-anchored protein
LISRRTIGVWGGLALVLGLVNVSVARKEWLRARGQPLLLELAPRDPRSLMQGDYMQLDYAVARALPANDGAAPTARDGFLVVRVDGRGVGTYVRLARPGETLAPDERRLRYRRRGWRVRVGTDAFFFQEGHAERFARARFADLRVDASGDVLLVGLRDAQTRPL